jgi:hypothetical protein
MLLSPLKITISSDQSGQLWKGNLMAAAELIDNSVTGQDQLVNFDTEGNIIVGKHKEGDTKLVARRAIEAHLERKRMQLDDYWDDLED